MKSLLVKSMEEYTQINVGTHYSDLIMKFSLVNKFIPSWVGASGEIVIIGKFRFGPLYFIIHVGLCRP